MPDFSPGFDPEISLRVGGAAPQAPQSPLSMVAQAVDIRNASNQNQLFQNQQSARFKLGRIMATAPDMETALKLAGQDPMISAFAQPELQAAQSNATSTLGRESTVQTLAQTSLDAAATASTAGATPGMTAEESQTARAGAQGAILASTAPAARDATAQGLRLFNKATGDDPKMIAAIGAGVGNPASVNAIIGNPSPSTGTTVNAAGQVVPSINRTPIGGPASISQLGSANPSSPGTVGTADSNPVADDFNALGAPRTPTAPALAGPTLLTQTLTPMQAANEAKTESQISDMSGSFQPMFARLGVLKDALGKVKIGGGSGVQEEGIKALQTLQALGFNIPDDQMNKLVQGGPGAAGALQNITSELGQIGAASMASIFKGSGSEATANVINKAADQLSSASTPDAVMTALNQVEQNFRVMQDMTEHYTDWQKMISKGTLPDGYAPGDYNRYYVNKVWNKKELPLDNNLGAFSDFKASDVKGSTEDSGSGSSLPTVTTPADYAKIPAGAVYLRDGKKYTKGGQ